MRGAIELTTSGPGGCLFVQGALATGAQGAQVRDELASLRRAAQVRLRGRFEKARVEGDLVSGVDVDALARSICATIYGLSVQAASGATAAELSRAVDMALAGWPGTH